MNSSILPLESQWVSLIRFDAEIQTIHICSVFPTNVHKAQTQSRLKIESKSLRSVNLNPNSSDSTHSDRCKQSRPAWWGRAMVSVATQPRSSSAARSSAATGLMVNKQRQMKQDALSDFTLGGGCHGATWACSRNTHPGRTGAGGGRPASPPARLWCQRWTRCSPIPLVTGCWRTVGRIFGPPSAFQSHGCGCPVKWHTA